LVPPDFKVATLGVGSQIHEGLFVGCPLNLTDGFPAKIMAPVDFFDRELFLRKELGFVTPGEEKDQRRQKYPIKNPTGITH